MADGFSAFAYAAAGAPLTMPPRFHTSQPSSPVSPGGANSEKPRSRLPFRHARTSSGSRIGSSSQETLSPTSTTSTSASASDRPATAVVGEQDICNGRHGRPTQHLQHPAASDSRIPTVAVAASRNTHWSDQAAHIYFGKRPSDHKYRNPDADTHSPISPNDVAMYAEQDAPKSLTPKAMNASFSRTESVSSNSGATSLSTRTMISTDPSASGEKESTSPPFILRNGRTYLNDPSLPYPLPSDLTELHRQCLRTLLLIQVFGAPVCSPSLIAKPPLRVLEVGCGSGFWSMMCHRYFKGRGHSGISFTGIDIAPLAPGSTKIASDSIKPDHDMKWKFVQHDFRNLPWPLPDEEYDLVMVKDMSLATTNSQHQPFFDEYIRLLRPGGTVEVWESDHTIRMLRPHVPGSGTNDDSEEQETASRLGSYVMTANTPLSAPLNTFLVEYNHWVSRSLEARDLSAVPCTLVGPMLLQEADALTDVKSRRLVIPLSEVRWEREGVGGVVTKDGKSYVEMKGKGAPHQKVEKKSLSSAQAALRKTALLTVVQQIQALEPILREVSGKSIDEWDLWLGKMMGDLMSESGTSWGECLEVGAWCARKQSS
ncbi:Secondary metabolism regulator laeA [Paramyrothecium foliicola]|nr:Secondary metabolism regulator laeA [Paramyrothecium foliicola]